MASSPGRGSRNNSEGTERLEPSLSPTYYRINFEHLIDSARQRNADLLGSLDHEVIAAYDRLSEGARCLWVRLLSRRGPLFRRDKLSYSEIPDLVGAIDELTNQRLLDEAPDAALQDQLALLRHRELVQLASVLGLGRSPAGERRPETLDRLRAWVPEALLGELVREVIAIVRPLGGPTVDRLRLLFFGNLRQDWKEFVLSDLDLWHYEDYPLTPELRRFQSRDVVDEILRVGALGQQVAPLIEQRKFLEAGDMIYHRAIHAVDSDPLIRRSLDRLILRQARDLVRCDQPEAALRLLELAVSPPARERRARLLSQRGDEAEALALLDEIDDRPRDESERVFAPHFRQRMMRRRGGAPARRPQIPCLELSLDRRSGSIEEQVLAHLRGSGDDGIHSENWLWSSLFGLIFWDVVFGPYQGAFQHPFQAGPLDLFEPSFHSLREQDLTERLRQVARGEWPAERIEAVWQSKSGTRNSLVSWHSQGLGPLRAAADHVEPQTMSLILGRLSRDLRRYRLGLPDLLWLPQAGGWELLEVKGPGDQLRPEQRSWMEFLLAHELPVRLLRVRWNFDQPSLSTTSS